MICEFTNELGGKADLSAKIGAHQSKLAAAAAAKLLKEKKSPQEELVIKEISYAGGKICRYAVKKSEENVLPSPTPILRPPLPEAVTKKSKPSQLAKEVTKQPSSPKVSLIAKLWRFVTLKSNAKVSPSPTRYLNANLSHPPPTKATKKSTSPIIISDYDYEEVGKFATLKSDAKVSSSPYPILRPPLPKEVTKISTPPSLPKETAVNSTPKLTPTQLPKEVLTPTKVFVPPRGYMSVACYTTGKPTEAKPQWVNKNQYGCDVSYGSTPVPTRDTSTPQVPVSKTSVPGNKLTTVTPPPVKQIVTSLEPLEADMNCDVSVPPSENAPQKPIEPKHPQQQHPALATSRKFSEQNPSPTKSFFYSDFGV